MENIIVLSALLKIVGLDGTNPATSSNPLPVSVANAGSDTRSYKSTEQTGAVNTAVSLTIPASDGYTFITAIVIELFTATARTAASTTTVATVTGFSSTISKLLPKSAAAIGTLETIQVLPTVEALASNFDTPVVVSVPAIAGCIVRIHTLHTVEVKL